MALNLLHKLPLTYSENGIQYYTRNNKQVNSGKNLTKSNNHQINIMSNNKGLSDVNRINEVNISNKIMTQETLEEAAEKWVFETNGHKWSNNDDTAGDNYGSFIAGAKWQQERSYSEEEVLTLLYMKSIYNNLYESNEEVQKWFNKFKKK